jgi:hypothetical protein
MRTNNPEQFNIKITPANSDLIREQQADARVELRHAIETAAKTGKISNVQLADVDSRDYPDFCDAYIESADIGERAMTDDELEILNELDFRDNYVQEHAFESLL